MKYKIDFSNPNANQRGIDDIAQSIFIILSTVKGSDPLRPDFGSDLHKYIDKPIPEVQASVAYSSIMALEKWEKRIKVKSCLLSADENDPAKRNLLIEASVIKSTSEFSLKIFI